MRDLAILDLLKDGSLKELSENLCPDYAEDLIQEVALLLLEMPEKKWIEINEGAYLRFYVVRTILNMATSPRSSFAKKHEVFVKKVDYKDTQDSEEYNAEIDEKLNQLSKALDDCHWYDKEIVLAWAREGSYRKVQEKTGIPFRSVGNTVKKTLDKIKSDIHGDNHIRYSRLSPVSHNRRRDAIGRTIKRLTENLKKRKP